MNRSIFNTIRVEKIIIRPIIIFNSGKVIKYTILYNPLVNIGWHFNIDNRNNFSRKERAMKHPEEFHVKRVSVFTPAQEREYTWLVVIWAMVNIYFWGWWFWQTPFSLGLYVIATICMIYTITALPTFYLFYVGAMSKPQRIDAQEAITAGVVKRIAMITLHVPGSENMEIVERQLRAMIAVEIPHDSWILVDKYHDEKIKRLAEELGVKYFCRHDKDYWGETRVHHWNQPVPPFQAKTKAGNVNAWIETYGEDYTHFVQLDIDHVPKPFYLQETLGYFLDPRVAWVQSPSVYGNLNKWTARGSAEQEFVLQGPLQMGFYGFCKTPFIIGSHCAYSTEAIVKIGGFAPTRAEDHLDTVILASQGYEGVFVPDILAVGDGPETFETYIAQQFAWAYSMIQVLFKYTPHLMRRYTKRQALQFLFVQTWYTLWSGTTFTLFLLPPVVLITNSGIARVSFWQFSLHLLPVALVSFLIWGWSREWHKPQNLSLSWRGVVLHVARWPVVLSAFIQVILRVKKPYMITIKGMHRGMNRPFSFFTHAPYLLIAGASLASCWEYMLTTNTSHAQGYLLFAWQEAVVILIVYLVALSNEIFDMKKEGVDLIKLLTIRVKPLMVALVFLMFTLITFSASAVHIISAVFSL